MVTATVTVTFQVPTKKMTSYKEIRKLLSKWKRFVREVAQGYEFSIYDFENDLSVRDIIDSLVDDHPSGASLTEELSRIDDRYREITRPVDSPPWAYPRDENEPGWWWFRIPQRLQGELSRDIERRKMQY